MVNLDELFINPSAAAITFILCPRKPRLLSDMGLLGALEALQLCLYSVPGPLRLHPASAKGLQHLGGFLTQLTVTYKLEEVSQTCGIPGHLDSPWTAPKICSLEPRLEVLEFNPFIPMDL